MITKRTLVCLQGKPTAEVIRQAVQESGLTQREIARRTGIRPETITRWVRGQREPAPVYLRLFIEAVRG